MRINSHWLYPPWPVLLLSLSFSLPGGWILGILGTSPRAGKADDDRCMGGTRGALKPPRAPIRLRTPSARAASPAATTKSG